MEIKRCYPALIGASVAENQLVQNGNFADTSGWTSYGTTFTTSNNEATITFPSTGTGVLGQTVSFTTGHKYLTAVSIKGDATYSAIYCMLGVGLVVHEYDISTKYKREQFIFNYNSTSNNFNILRTNASTSEKIYIKNAVLTDLTAKFGSSIADYVYSLETATAGAGVAKLQEWGFLTDGYIPYNPGSLESVEATAHKMVGFNQWDEVAETGTYNLDTGTPISTSSYFRTKNPIKALPNTTYHIASGGDAVYVFFYGADDNYLGYRTFSGQSNIDFTTAINCYYIRFVDVTRNVYDPSVKPICINLSNPDRNGEYEAYASQSYALGSDKLRGIFKLDANNRLYADGDRKTSDGTITRRYGVVDLGTLDWTYNGGYFDASGTFNVPSRTQWETQNGITSLYTIQPMFYVINADNRVDKSIAWYSTAIRVADSAYTDAATFKEAMSGVMLVYETATPTTEQSTPFTFPQICYPDGTEEYVTSNGVPVGHETRYEL